MRQLLVSPLIPILKSRIFLSREAQIFKIEEIAQGWVMSRMTLYRYDSPLKREQSRELARQKTEQIRLGKHRNCTKCNEPLISHKRCNFCTILTHDALCSCEERFALLQQKRVFSSHSI